MILRAGQRMAHVPGLGVRTSSRAVSAGGPSYIIYDTFTGSGALTSHSPDVGGSWIESGGGAVWSISSNKATNNDQYTTYAIIDSSVYDCTVEVVLNPRDATSSFVRGLIARFSDASNYYKIGVKYTANEFGIYNISNGSLSSTAFTVTPGVDHTIVAVMSGTTITATINGGNQVVYNSASLTGTYHGMAGRYTGDTMDNFAVY